DVLINQVNTFEEQNNEFNDQMKVLNEKNVDLLAQTEVLQDQLKIKHVVIDTHTLVEMNNNVLRLQEKILEKETKISELEGCVSNNDVEIEKCLERLNECENKLHKIRQTNETIHMIMLSKDTIMVERNSLLKLNKDIKRYSRKDLLSCNNSHLRETSSAYVCNDAMNVSCNTRVCDLFDENNLFIFNDECVRISLVSKMPFRKKPRDSMNVRSKRCSKHMTGNRALLTYFVENFLGTVRFGNNDFAVIAGYGDVVIRAMTTKKVYYKTQVNLQLQVQRIRTDNGTEFKNKTLAKFFDEVSITQKFSAARTPQQNGVVERRNL
nr:retrotransposon protein, putative, Ty1-copia subclass [Tanacetum cinerariifolium]